MNAVEAFVSKLTDPQRVEICRNFEEFEATGVTGDTTIRRLANQLMEELGVTSNVVTWMQLLAFEAYRHYGRRVIDELYYG